MLVTLGESLTIKGARSIAFGACSGRLGVDECGELAGVGAEDHGLRAWCWGRRR